MTLMYQSSITTLSPTNTNVIHCISIQLTTPMRTQTILTLITIHYCTDNDNDYYLHEGVEAFLVPVPGVS